MRKLIGLAAAAAFTLGMWWQRKQPMYRFR